jgi:hypothetical protein
VLAAFARAADGRVCALAVVAVVVVVEVLVPVPVPVAIVTGCVAWAFAAQAMTSSVHLEPAAARMQGTTFLALTAIVAHSVMMATSSGMSATVLSPAQMILGSFFWNQAQDAVSAREAARRRRTVILAAIFMVRFLSGTGIFSALAPGVLYHELQVLRRDVLFGRAGV